MITLAPSKGIRLRQSLLRFYPVDGIEAVNQTVDS
jgi:hypothetical protein